MPLIDRFPLLKFISLGSLLLTFFIGTSLFCAQPKPLSSSQTSLLPNFKTLCFVLVDDPNNEVDSETGLGAVSDNFQIGTYQITAAQYALFLNAVTPTENRYGLYDEGMTSDPDVACITYDPTQVQHYKAMPGRENFPITYVDLFCAVRFCNWMSHGCPVIDATKEFAPNKLESITETGAYKIHCNQDSGGIITPWIEATANAPFFIPNEDQWYKAAYYHHDTGKIITYDPEDPIPSAQNQVSLKYWNYSTQSMNAPLNSPAEFAENIVANYFNHEVSSFLGPDYTTNVWSYWNSSYLHSGAYLTPVGTFSNSPGPYGTFDMAGNVNELIFSNNAGAHPDQPLCVIRGGSWQSTSADLNRQTRHLIAATTKNNTTGFRIACQDSPTAALSTGIEKNDDLTSDVIQNAIAGNQTYQMIGEVVLCFITQEACEMALVYQGAVEGCLLRDYLLKMAPTGLLLSYIDWALFGSASAIKYAAQWGISMGLDSIGLAVIDTLGKEEAAKLAGKYGLQTAVDFYEHLHDSVDRGLHGMRGVEN